MPTARKSEVFSDVRWKEFFILRVAVEGAQGGDLEVEAFG